MAERDYAPDEWSDRDFFVVTRPGDQEALRHLEEPGSRASTASASCSTAGPRDRAAPWPGRARGGSRAAGACRTRATRTTARLVVARARDRPRADSLTLPAAP